MIFFQSVMQLIIQYAKYFWKREKNEFSISSAVLVLIYRQVLIWVMYRIIYVIYFRLAAIL